MVIQIRKAGPGDLRIIDDFQHKLGVFHRKFDQNMRQKGRVRYISIKDIEKILKARNQLSFIAHVENKPVGMIIGKIKKHKGQWSLYSHFGHVAFLYVEEKYQNKGIGKLLLKHMIKWFEKRHIKAIYIDVYKGNSNAHKLYEKMGFEDSEIIMVLR